jgi:hypothetical protein
MIFSRQIEGGFQLFNQGSLRLPRIDRRTEVVYRNEGAGPRRAVIPAATTPAERRKARRSMGKISSQ